MRLVLLFKGDDGLLYLIVTGVQACVFFFQAEDGIRDLIVTGVQTCALPFSSRRRHTRSDRDWSSDVCSSDLCAPRAVAMKPTEVKVLEEGSKSWAEAIGRPRSSRPPAIRTEPSDRKSVV